MRVAPSRDQAASSLTLWGNCVSAAHTSGSGPSLFVGSKATAKAFVLLEAMKAAGEWRTGCSHAETALFGSLCPEPSSLGDGALNDPAKTIHEGSPPSLEAQRRKLSGGIVRAWFLIWHQPRQKLIWQPIWNEDTTRCSVDWGILSNSMFQNVFLRFSVILATKFGTSLTPRNNRFVIIFF